jgi:hypothetical protein
MNTNNASTSIRVKTDWVYRVLLIVMLAAGFAVRMVDLTDPPLDFHPTRQLRGAIIARGIYSQIVPYADVQKQSAAVATWQSLPKYEPPIFESIVALTYAVTGGEHLWVSRIYSSLFWVTGGLVLALLARKWGYKYGGLIALAFYLYLPFSIIASRSFQPDPFMVVWTIFTAAALDAWAEKQTLKTAVIAGLVGGMTVLVKIFTVFPVAAMAVAVVLSTLGFRKAVRSTRVWLMAVLMAAPAFIYYILGLGSASGSFADAWTVSMLHLLLSPSFYFKWLAMISSLTGLTVFFIALAGFVLIPGRPRWILLGLWMGYLFYGLTSPFQFTTHTYYHLQLIPLIALSLVSIAEIGIRKLVEQPVGWRVLACGVMVFAAVYCMYTTRSQLVAEDYRSEPIPWQAIGEAVPHDGPVIALTQDFGTRLMYYGWTKVSAYWPTESAQNLATIRGKEEDRFEASFLRTTQEKHYFLVTALGQLEKQPNLKNALAGYTVVSQGDGFILYDLTKPVSNSK